MNQSFISSKRTARDFLKAALMETRRGKSTRGIVQHLECPYCNVVIEGDTDLHEGLVSRGKAQGSDDTLEYAFLMSRYNCVLPCKKCHANMVGVGGREGFEKAARHLVKHETYFGVHAWLQIAAEKLEAGKEALRWFEAMEFSNLEKGRSDVS